MSISQKDSLFSFELDINNIDNKKLITPLELQDFSENLDFGKINISIGNRPIARNLRTLFKLQDKVLPPELEIFSAFDIWMITYGIQISNESKFKSVRQIGLEIQYHNGIFDPRVTIIENMPDTNFHKIVSGQLNINFGIKIDGTVTVPTTNTYQNSIDLGFGGKMFVNEDANVGINLDLSLLSSNIISNGIGADNGGWIINHTNQKPLEGDQLFVQTILTPVNMEMTNIDNLIKSPLKVDARVFATVTGPLGAFPIRMKGDPKELEIYLV